MESFAADGRYSAVVTKQKKHLLRKPLQDLLKKFSSSKFVQTHRSYAINLEWVTSVDFFENIIHLGDFQVPLSKRNKDDFLNRLEKI